MKKGILGILSFLAGAAGGAIGIKRMEDVKVRKARGYADKHLALFLMMNQWVKVKQEGKNLVAYFENNGYKRIAIYGMSYAGETLLEELKESEVQVVYGIDKRADGIYANLDVITIDEPLNKVDAIVVTAITFFDEIESLLSEKIDCPIISLEDILYDI